MNSKPPIISLSSSYLICFLFYTFVIFPSLNSTATSPSNYHGNETDHRALQKIRLTITKDPYGALTSWNNSLHFCDWFGVTCGRRHRRVTSLVLESQGLEGLLSPHVGNLSFLRELRLANNSFQGAIPLELGRLSRLRFLNIKRNKFNGFIPTNISGCSNLEGLRLSYNELVGSIPNEISFLSKLTVFSVSYNNLTGGIPPFLGNITSMEALDLSENPLGGSIPETLGNLKVLKGIYSSICSLSGTIPHSLYNLSFLTTFSFTNNQLSGGLPSAIMLPSLVGFGLWGNQLTGILPSSISNCSRLRILEVTGNKFSGKLTIDFSKLSDIMYIRLGDNLFGSKEADEMEFIDSMKNCTRLKEMDIGECKFQGVLPGSIGNLSNQLQYLALGANHLHGSIPGSIGNLVGLLLLILGPNKFTRNIPSTIGNLQKLETLDLSNNGLSGTIPNVLGNLSKLFYLSLGSNKLEGHIPSSLGKLYRLSYLFLNDNKLFGKIPAQLFQLSSLSKTLDLSRNNFFGSLPTEVGDLKMLGALYLSYNNLSGNIPSSLGGCVGLFWLSLEANLFQGIIPPSLSSLKALVKLDVSQNNLSGQIPQFLEGFSSLEYLNLSYNDFEGEVPMQGVFTNSSAYSILGNTRLCGDIVDLGLPKCKEVKNRKKVFPTFVIAILIASTLLTITCLTYAWLKKKRKSQLSQSSSTRDRFLKVSYNQLLKATDGFSEANLIGQGGFSSVYKGILDENDNKFVAIKVLNLQNRGAQSSFIRECEAWRSIRHRNLVRIITSCSTIDFHGNDFKALVYEFMPKGSLHDWLHSSEGTHSLNLLQRIDILMDVACALDYIHNQCVPTLVHGDLKPSNVLLDADMVAHVGDFGLARFLGTTYQNISTGLGGTIGYAAPEYGLGSEMTSSGDIYSFGILLLEVMTGKKPTDDIFNESLSLHKFASIALQDYVMDVIDGNILNVYQGMSSFNNEAKAKKIEECLALTVKIGVSCSQDSPSQRMNIQKVVHELRHIHDTLQNIEI